MADEPATDQTQTAAAPTGAAAPGQTASGAAGAGSSASPAPAQADAAPRPEKPEGVPDAFWDAEKGVDFAKWSQEHAELVAEKAARDSAAASVVESPDKYEISLPADVPLPEGFEFDISDSHPMVGPLREFAFANKLTQEQVNGLVKLDLQRQLGEIEQMREAASAEKAKLGSKATERIDAVTRWAQATLGAEHANALLPMMYSARQVEAFEKLITAAGGKLPSYGSGGREAASTPAQDLSGLSGAALIHATRQNLKAQGK